MIPARRIKNETDGKEERMLKGDMGRGVQCAMEVLVKMGELYGAEEFVEVKNAHIDAAAYTTIWDAGTEFVEFLVENSARVAVPATINPMSVDRRNWRNLEPQNLPQKCDRLENAYETGRQSDLDLRAVPMH